MAKLPSYLAMRVPLLDLSEQHRALGDSTREAINAVLASGRFILGPKVEAFEKAIAAYCNTPHAVGVSSGTDALLTILMALGIGPGDAVITTPYTFFATAGCVARVGARPVFADIDPETYNISPSAIRDYIENNCHAGPDGAWRTKSGEKLRAIVPVHLFGLSCEMDALRQISERFRLDLIEDAAQAIGAESPFRGGTSKAGTQGEVGFFSFYPSKNLGAAGDAGMIVCRDETLATKLQIIREHEMEPAIYYPLGLHEQKCFAYLGYKKGDFPETERAARETLALPIYPEISRETQRYVVGAIADFYS